MLIYFITYTILTLLFSMGGYEMLLIFFYYSVIHSCYISTSRDYTPLPKVGGCNLFAFLFREQNQINLKYLTRAIFLSLSSSYACISLCIEKICIVVHIKIAATFKRS